MMPPERDVPPSPRENAVLRLLALVQRVNFHLFWVGLALILGGAALMLLVGEAATYVAGLGFLIMVILVAESFLVYPFLRCPHCGNRFFMANGALAVVFHRIDPLRTECLHCGLNCRP